MAAAPFFLLGLGAVPFDDPGEGMHAEIARELLRSGPGLPLTLNGVAYLDKPPLLYALLAGAFSVAGTREAPARAVSAAAALVTIAATAWLGARLLGGRSGLVAGLALSTSLGFFVYGRYVRPETLLLATLAVGFALALTALVESSRARMIAGLAVFGLAALAKDPLAALGPPLAIGLALALGGRARPLERWLPWPGVILGLVLAFGWWAMAEYSTPGFAWYTVVDNHLLNVARARHFPDEDIPLGAGEFLAVAALGIVPWIVPAVASVVRLVRRRAWREPEELPWVALALWAIGVLGLTALSPFRLPHYGLPAYPALALLAARGWSEVSGRTLALLHAALFGALAVAATLAWTTDGSAFMTSVLGATDVATRKMSAAGGPPPLPSWSAFRPLVGAAALTLAAGAVALAVTAADRCPHGRHLCHGGHPDAAAAERGQRAGPGRRSPLREVDRRADRAQRGAARHRRPRGPDRERGSAGVVFGPATGDRRRAPQRAGLRRHAPGGGRHLLGRGAPGAGLAGLAPRVGGHRPAAGAEPGGPAAGRAPGRRDRRAQPLRQPMRRAAIS